MMILIHEFQERRLSPHLPHHLDDLWYWRACLTEKHSPEKCTFQPPEMLAGNELKLLYTTSKKVKLAKNFY